MKFTADEYIALREQLEPETENAIFKAISGIKREYIERLLKLTPEDDKLITITHSKIYGMTLMEEALAATLKNIKKGDGDA